MKRVFLFILVNILVILTISITINILGVRPYLTYYGIDYQALLIFCAIVGFSGALISLALSRFMAKAMLGVKLIDPERPSSSFERELVQTVQRLSNKAGLPVLPEIGIYPSPEVNAFATGPTKSKALVAVSQGLANRMDRRALEGVLGHEIAHVANGDMVTMTLIQGVINTFVMFFARVLAWGLSTFLSGDRESRRDGFANPFIHYIFIFVFEIIFSILGAIVVAYFSRKREFRADKGGANLAGRETMIYALSALKENLALVDKEHQSVSTLKISGGKKGFLSLFATHPDLDLRIERLKQPLA